MKKSIYTSYDELPLLLNVKQLVDLMGVSDSSIYELIQEDDFPSLRIGKRIVVPKEELRKWIAAHRSVGMLNTPYVKKDTIKNFFPVPNAVFDLGLHHMEINIYAYLLRIEDRRTYQCLVSYPTIARKLGISVNTVAKYVAALEEHGLIRTEHTEIITKDGHKRNGCLRYTILPIKNALDLCYKRQLEKAEQALERQRTQANAERLGIQFVPADDERSA